MQQLVAPELPEAGDLPGPVLTMLAAISHDLMTPITRMKLRVEQMDDSHERQRLWKDLNEMQHLVQTGVAYVRNVNSLSEPPCRVDLDAFLDGLVSDYQDCGRAVTRGQRCGVLLQTRPHALRRVLTNLIDNALKYAGSAHVQARLEAQGYVQVRILDEGPGIAEASLEEVFKPFFQLPGEPHRSAGGAGLGLAIAHQLSRALGACLTLHNRTPVGLCAQLALQVECPLPTAAVFQTCDRPAEDSNAITR
jgi:signal transduction histidine kinase